MASKFPFSLLESLMQGQSIPQFTPAQAPEWLIAELRGRLVLLLNHILMQEPEAMARLARQKGRVMWVRWRGLAFKFLATPAGLLEWAQDDAPADLTLTATEESVWGLAQSALRGQKPSVRIEGDVQLAAEVNWLTEHVRWDIEEDLARLLGDVPARILSQWALNMTMAVREFCARASSFVPGQAAR